MKRLGTLVLLFSIVSILTSCTGIHYRETNYTLNGLEVYRYDHRTSEIECDRISSFGLFVRDGDNDYVTNKDFGECMNTLFVKDGGLYHNLSEGLVLGLYTIEDVLEVDWDFDVYATHELLHYTEVDSFVFVTSESETYDDADGIQRVLDISGSVYQKFIVGYSPTSMQSIGEIQVYFEETLIVTLIVYEEGIYDPLTEGFQERHSSELQGLFESVVN